MVFVGLIYNMSDILDNDVYSPSFFILAYQSCYELYIEKISVKKITDIWILKYIQKQLII